MFMRAALQLVGLLDSLMWVVAPRRRPRLRRHGWIGLRMGEEHRVYLSLWIAAAVGVVTFGVLGMALACAASTEYGVKIVPQRHEALRLPVPRKSI
jgi:hypothetical protein